MKNQNSLKKITKKLLFVFLLLLLLPCFAFGTSPPIAASKVKANPPGTKLKKQIVPKNISKKMALKSAMKITSITFKTNASGDWTFLYDSENTGLVTFAPHQLQYKSTQILTNGTRVPIHTVTYNRSNTPGTKSSAHSPWNRCSKASKLMLEIIHQGKVLDKKTVNMPPINVKINNLSSLNGKFKALLKNNTSYTSKVTVKVVSKSPLKGSGGSKNSVGAETIVIVPANSSKTCTGAIAEGGKTINLEVLFRDEKKCSGKGYVVLDRKVLPAAAGSGLSKAAKVKALAGKVKVAGNLRSGVTPPPQPSPPNPTPSDLPNLIITNVNLTLLGDSQFSISYQVKNIGGLCEHACNVGLSRNGTSVEQVYVPALEPNGIYDGNFNFSSQQTTAAIALRADLYNVIVESDEQDNQWSGIANNPVSFSAELVGQIATEPVSVVPIVINNPYDLVLGTVTLTEDRRLKITMSNAGPEISQAQYNRLGLAVSIDNSAVNYKVFKILPMTTVDPGGTLKIHGNPPWQVFIWPLRSTDSVNGMDRFDVHNNIYEVKVSIGILVPGGGGLNIGAPDSNPANNTMTKRIGGMPDLVVCFKKHVHHKHASRSYTYRPVVRNIGTAPSGPSNLRFYIKNKGGKDYSIPPLPVGGKYQGIKRKVYWVRKGIRSFKLTVDSNDDVYESSSGGGEFNNIIRGTIQVNKYAPTSQTQCSDAPGMADH